MTGWRPRAAEWVDGAVRDALAPPTNTSAAAYALVLAWRRIGQATGTGRPSLPGGVTSRSRSVGSDGDPVTVRCYRPRTGTEPLPVTVFLHGGGWISGDLDTNHRLCGHLAVETGRAVVAVDYRLAPEHRYPAPLDDCERVLDWLATQGARNGLDPDDVALFGASAGGTLAAALTVERDAEARPPIRHRTLAYPPLDPEFDERIDDPGPLRRAARPLLAGLWDCYLPPDADRTDPRIAPLRATEVASLPPTTVVTCGFDPLRPEGRTYARRLAETTVPVAHVSFPSYPHGFLTLLPRVSRARTVAALRRIHHARPAVRER
jgi:acetyl esterase